MKILRSSILDYRNLTETNLEFSPQVNLFLGGNGQGKTNLLEALNYIALGRSHRGARNIDLIRFDADHLNVEIVAEPEAGSPLSFQYSVHRNGGRRIRVEGEVIRRRLDLVGLLQTVIFSPESIDLVRGGPDRRRRFCDRGIVGVDPPYLAHLQAYLRSVRQKTRLLRELKARRSSGTDAVEEVTAWNRKLAGHAAVICRGRAEYAAQVTPSAARVYALVAGELSELELFTP